MAKRIRSAIKKHRQSLKRRARNIHIRSFLKTVIKELNAAIEAKDLAKSQEALKSTVSALSKAASKGVINKRTVSRNVARLSKKVHALSKQLTQPSV
jgi:small subunit ribosomal protein S20